MMRGMGWSGGALGARGTGIIEPIMLEIDQVSKLTFILLIKKQTSHLINIHVHAYVYVRAYVYVHAIVRTCASVRAYVCVHAYVCVRACVCVRTCECVHVWFLCLN